MSSEGERLRQKYELDWTETRDKWRSRFKRGVQQLENSLLEKAFQHLGPANSSSNKAESQNKKKDVDGEKEEGEEEDRDSDWFLGGERLRILGLCEETDQELEHLKRSVVGNLKVRVKSLVCEEATKAFFDLTVEGETIRSPIAFQQGGSAFIWEMEVRLPVTDITGTFCLEFFRSSLLSTGDKSIGRLIVPFFALLDRGQRKSRTGMYVLYPSAPTSGIPGHRKSMGTGFDREFFDEAAFVTVRHELELFGSQRMLWPLYLENRRAVPKHMKKTPDRENSVRSLSLPQELLHSVSELKRNGARIETAVAEMLNSLPVSLLLYLRSWDNPLLTSVVIALTLTSAKYVSAWTAPFVLYFIVCVLCVLSKKVNHENENWVVFNDEIDRDPDGSLSPVQRLARLAKRFDQAAKLVGILASLLEKLVNAWNFSDPIATTIMLQGLFFIACGWATTAYVAHLMDMSFLGPVLVAVVIVPIPHGHGMFLRVKQSALALFDRIPTHDDLGRIWLAKKQAVQEMDSVDR